MRRRHHLVRALLCLLTVVGVVGCEREKGNAGAATRPAAASVDLDMKPLTPLLPNRPTHATVDALGNVYWVQETDRGDDTMFVIGEGGIPRATQLSVANVAALLGADGARGNIHGIAAPVSASGDIYFYFQAVHGRRTIAAVGVFAPKREQVRILADTDAVASATGMGRSLPLARGTVVSDGRVVWIWLRHTDNWAVFRLEPGRFATSGPAQLPKAFETVKLDGKPIELTREELEIAPAPGGGLFLLDVPHAVLLRIAPDGNATVVRSLVGLTSALSSPSIDEKQNLVLFAGNGQIIGAKSKGGAGAAGGGASGAASIEAEASGVDATFPALLIFKPDKVVSIGRDHMQAYPGFPVFSTRLKQLVPHQRDGGWVTYDASSGELLRVKVVENLWP